MEQDDRNSKFNFEEVSEAFKLGNYKFALEKILPFVEQEDPNAISYLGLCYHLGFGVERNGAKALELYKKAIDLGSGGAAHNLGTLYVTDIPGISKDEKLSKYYYRKAKEMGAQFANDEFYE